MNQVDNYLTDSKIGISNERLTDQECIRAEEIASKFYVISDAEGLCGNVRVYFKNNKAKLGPAYASDDALTRDYQQISSALALYRTISLFKCGIDSRRVDFYKMNWSICLNHEKSGQVLGLGEWKGGFQIFTQASCVENLDKTFIKDSEKLITLLVSDKCPIGYDGVVAGSVA